jgi:hypothetical protein
MQDICNKSIEINWDVWFHGQIVCSNVRLPCLLLIYINHVDFGCCSLCGCFLNCLFCTVSVVNSEWHTSNQSISFYTYVSYNSRLCVSDYINPDDFVFCFLSCHFLLLTLRHTCARAVSVVNSEWHTSKQAKQGTSGNWSMSHLAHRPINPAYYIEDCCIDFGCCFLSCLFLQLTLRHTCARAVSVVNSEWHTSKGCMMRNPPAQATAILRPTAAAAACRQGWRRR